MSSSKRVDKQLAFLLHRWPYRETSLMLAMLTLKDGHIIVAARGARRPRYQNRVLLQPFVPLQLSYTARSDVMQLTRIESVGLPYRFSPVASMSAFYVNELILRLFHRYDPDPRIYELYQKTLERLQCGEKLSCQHSLRFFELDLLHYLGYGLDFEQEYNTGAAIEAHRSYVWHAGEGFKRCEQAACCDHKRHWQGTSLLALKERQLNQLQHVQEARDLMRCVIDHYVGQKSLKTRDFLRKMLKIGA